MLMLTKYAFRPGKNTPEEIAAFLAAAAEAGLPETDDQLGHWIAIDTSEGVMVYDVTDPKAFHHSMIQLQEWITIDSTPVIPVADSIENTQTALLPDS